MLPSERERMKEKEGRVRVREGGEAIDGSTWLVG